MIKKGNEIEIMAEGGRALAEVMEGLKKEVRPGITTNYLDKLAQELILKSNNIPGFLNYQGFPKTLCTSVNEVVVHGLPSEYILKNGDILSLDLGLIHNGYYADMAVTVPVGEISEEKKFLIRAVKKSLNIAIKKAKPGNTLGDIGNTIERYLSKRGLSVFKELCGHGIGRELHEEPEVLNYGKRKQGEILKKGMVLCLEPMATPGKARIKKADDGFGLKSIDDSLSAHFEHMIVILDKGSKVLTCFEQ